MHRFHHRNIDQFQNAFTGMFLLQTVELYIVMCNGLSQRNQQLQLHGTTLGNPSDKTRGNCSPKCSQGITFEVPRETLSTGHFLCIADTVKFQGLLVFEFLCFARSLSSVFSEHSEIIPKRQFVKSHQLQIAWLEVKIALKLLEQAWNVFYYSFMPETAKNTFRWDSWLAWHLCDSSTCLDSLALVLLLQLQHLPG